ncbi:enoyl-CoA hydratase/isomerase family protein [Microbacterium sp. 2FI]|uniref:enoyl-CoA hydratase/isomerase family protein n=1 Tax=Microbacterium sp. 2FI TaxID=2502193 RepID=UPI0010F5FCCE|nr:enoyl-CoA hydratase/isomerase family protein [Microbacterium sp. 2FI]
MTDVSDPTVLVRARGGLGRLTLNRPRAINALDLGMIHQLHAALDAWEHDSEVDIVVLDGAGERGLCAGGDVRGLADRVVNRRLEDAAVFFRDEYALNVRIAEYPKPIVALADGITMGGGIGLAGHAAIRVVTERSQLAMPETRIGFTPDVGGSWLLARAPGRLGEYLGLTGATMDAADAVYAGFADHLVPSESLEGLREALETRADPSSPTELVLLFDETPAPSKLEQARVWIDEAFAADSVADIIERLRALADDGDGSLSERRRDERSLSERQRDERSLSERQRDEARATAELLGELSPTGLAVTLAAVRRARELAGLRDALEQEYGLVMWFATTQPDLAEGIRAQVIDKDRSPKWQPATLAELQPEAAASAFSFRPDVPLWD